MRKLLLLSIFVLSFGLSACVEESPYVDDSKDQEQEQQNETPEQAPTQIVTIIEEVISYSLDYLIESGPVSGTDIKAHYIGVNDTFTEVHILRMEYEGRWSNIDYLIIIDSESDTIKAVKIVSHGENWGSFIELDSFLNQFIDKDISYYLTNDVLLGVDGDASATTTISGFNRTLEEAITYYQNNIE